MRKTVRLFAVCLVALAVGVGHAQAVGAPSGVTDKPHDKLAHLRAERPLLVPVIFRHGDVSWLSQLATEAGWPKRTHKKLAQIILRESGGCPNRRGGDVVDKDCNITRVSEWNHRSDTGLLQINGVHWKQDHPNYHGLICKEMGICTQEPLLDALTNLRAGKLLFDVAGWSPWQTN
jgi:hypothetical protein